MNNNSEIELGYTGHVTVKLVSDDAILKQNTYHNAGRGNLFKFIAGALSGNYIRSLRPCNLRLFDSTGHSISPLVYQTATTVPICTNDNGCVTLTFSIPGAYISGDSLSEARLYGADPKADSDYLANVSLSAEEEMPAKTGDSLLVIEWTMIISNKQ